MEGSSGLTTSPGFPYSVFITQGSRDFNYFHFTEAKTEAQHLRNWPSVRQRHTQRRELNTQLPPEANGGGERREARLIHTRRSVRAQLPLVPALGVGQRQAAGDEAHPERDAPPVSVEGLLRLRRQRVRGAGPEPRGLGRRGLPADLGHRRALGHVGGGLAHVLHCKQRADSEPRSARRVPAGRGFRRRARPAPRTLLHSPIIG